VSSNDVPPLWLETVRRIERAIGVPIESAVRTDAYFDLVTQANRARTRMTQTFEELSEQWLHLFNVPAASEVRRLREQLGRVERQLNRVAKELADDREEAAAPKPKPKPRTGARPRAASSKPKPRTPPEQ
jgi:hypothetical protein